MKQSSARNSHAGAIEILLSLVIVAVVASACAEPAWAQAMDKDPNDKGMGMGMKGKGMMMKGMSMDEDPNDEGMGMMMMGMSMMGMMDDDMGEMAMMEMGEDTVPASSVPGFPGITHLYHVGATGFFLNHAEHLQLSAEQQSRLSAIQTKSDEQQKELQAKVDEAEKEVWASTSSDEPNAQDVVNKIKASEALQTEKRVSFILSVEEAATVLTEAQQQLLVSPSDEKPTSDSH